MTCNERHLVMAMTLCAHAHEGQKDKAGNPYILHPLRVAAAGTDLDQVVLGLLHDVVEDTTYTLADLRKQGFPETLVRAVDAISKRRGESREAYLRRVAGNALATAVKLHDWDNNADPRRLALLEAEKAAWLALKYEEARQILKAYLQGGMTMTENSAQQAVIVLTKLATEETFDAERFDAAIDELEQIKGSVASEELVDEIDEIQDYLQYLLSVPLPDMTEIRTELAGMLAELGKPRA